MGPSKTFRAQGCDDSGSQCLVDPVISLESHQEPVAALFNIIILCNLAIYIASAFADLIRLLKLCVCVFFFA